MKRTFTVDFRFVTAALMMLLASLIAACGEGPTSQAADSVNVNNQQEVYNRTQPIPTFDWSQDRAALIQIYSLKNEARNTYSAIMSDGTGELMFLCPSIGYPIPADTQLTNPWVPVWYGSSGGSATIAQPEPNGLFSSENTDATYVLCLRETDGRSEVAPVQTESKVTTFPFPVRYNPETGMLEDAGGASTISLDLDRPNSPDGEDSDE